jgi:hypothetical protein
MYLSVKAKGAGEGFPIFGRDSHILARTDLTEVGREVDAVLLMPSKAERISILTSFEAERNDSHPHQIASVDTLETLGNHSFDSLKTMPYRICQYYVFPDMNQIRTQNLGRRTCQEHRSLGSPITRTATSVLSTSENYGGKALRFVSLQKGTWALGDCMERNEVTDLITVVSSNVPWLHQKHKASPQ